MNTATDAAADRCRRRLRPVRAGRAGPRGAGHRAAARGLAGGQAGQRGLAGVQRVGLAAPARRARRRRAARGACVSWCERHESLRATFSPSGDELCIAETVRAGYRAARPVAARRRRARRRGCASGCAPRSRRRSISSTARCSAPSCWRSAPRRAPAVLTAHHIVCDGWSFGVLVRDLAAAVCAALSASRGAELRPAPLSFADYALVAGDAAADRGSSTDDERYWLSRFAGRMPGAGPAGRPAAAAPAHVHAPVARTSCSMPSWSTRPAQARRAPRREPVRDACSPGSPRCCGD